MREFPEPQQESAAACENWDIRAFRGPKQMTTVLCFTYLKNQGLEALSFQGTFLKKLFCKHEV